MKYNFSILEILEAVEDLQKPKHTKKTKNKEKKNIDNSSIPKDTLRLIEEAEKNI